MSAVVSVFKRSWKIVLSSWVIASCASYQHRMVEPLTQDKVSFPTAVCRSMEGGLLWKLSVEEQSWDGQSDWIVDHEGGWVFEVVDPWGQIHASIKHSALSSLELQPRLPLDVKVRKSFFEIDGHRIAMKPGEVPCILSGKLPQDWLASMKKTPKGSWIYKDGHRKIFIREKDWGWKVVIKWPTMWGLWSEKIVWKLKKDEDTFSSLRIRDVVMEWKRFEG